MGIVGWGRWWGGYPGAASPPCIMLSGQKGSMAPHPCTPPPGAPRGLAANLPVWRTLHLSSTFTYLTCSYHAALNTRASGTGWATHTRYLIFCQALKHTRGSPAVLGKARYPEGEAGNTWAPLRKPTTCVTWRLHRVRVCTGERSSLGLQQPWEEAGLALAPPPLSLPHWVYLAKLRLHRQWDQSASP